MLVCAGACVCMFVGIYALRIVTTDKIHSLQILPLFYLLSLNQPGICEYQWKSEIELVARHRWKMLITIQNGPSLKDTESSAAVRLAIAQNAAAGMRDKINKKFN